MKGGLLLLYFDQAATSWPKPEIVYQVHDQVLRKGGNAGRGVNQSSLAASRELFAARENLARLFSVRDSDRIIFTQNVTEALNTGLRGLLTPGDHALISSVEHNAVVRPLEYLRSQGVEYSLVPCTKEGVLELERLATCLTPKSRLLCVTHASNVLGAIQPLREIGDFARKHGLIFMVDAAQSAGIIPLNAEELQIDFLAFTGHKGLLGPPGTGGFYAKPGLIIKPLIHGGTGSQSSLLSQPETWPEGMESGTRNTPGLAALGAAAGFILEKGVAAIRQHELQLMEILLDGLARLPGGTILGPAKASERTGLVSCNFAGFTADYLANVLDRDYGIVTRAGLHCAPLAHKTAGTLECGALRLSVGLYHTREDIIRVLEALEEIITGKNVSIR